MERTAGGMLPSDSLVTFPDARLTTQVAYSNRQLLSVSVACLELKVDIKWLAGYIHIVDICLFDFCCAADNVP